MFERLKDEAPDPLLALIKACREDPRPGKIDLGVGVYRDHAGHTPVMGAVKAAERRLLESQPSKAYLGAEGDPVFVELLTPIVLGSDFTRRECVIGIQTPGGTGALRLAAELIARTETAQTIWLGLPTWPNHQPILAAAGLMVETYPYFDVAGQRLLVGEMMEALSAARPGDLVLLHGCCHNPTGAGLSPAEWRDMADFVAARRLVPLIDLAYQGLGQGLEADAAGMRLVVEAAEQALIAYSCDKNFGLYRERTGALFAVAHDGATAAKVRTNLLALARANWSMPPDHGAAIVRAILEAADLTQLWHSELGSMCRRLTELRAALARAHPRLAPLAAQEGIFATLPIARHWITLLRQEHGIYMAPSGRINVAGLNPTNLETFVAAVEEYL